MKLAFIVVPLLLLAGCASATALPEDIYFDTVREHPGFDALQDDTIRAVGGDICNLMKANGDQAYVATLKILLDEDIEAGDAGAIISMSVFQYCPDQLDKIPSP